MRQTGSGSLGPGEINSDIVTTCALAHLPTLAQRRQAGEIDAAAYVTLYVLSWQVARYGRRVAQRRSRRDALPDGLGWLAEASTLHASACTEFLADLFARYELRGVRRRVGVALYHWLRGEWLPTLLSGVPTPRAVLRLQAAGSRPVTVIAAYPRMLQPVVDKADAYAFVCHDLEHAWQYFHDPTRCHAQQRLARRLERAWAAGAFDRYLVDPVFAEKFAYLAADMNTHVMHSLQYLRAILIEHHLRHDGLNARAPLSASARDAVAASLVSLLGDAATFVLSCRGETTPTDIEALEAAL